MTDLDLALLSHVARARAARAVAVLFWIAAAVAALAGHRGAAVALTLAGLTFRHLGDPGPDPALDRATGRGQ